MLISFGELLADMIRGGDERRFRSYPGGAPANFSVALARLGLRPKLVASVGRDPCGDKLIKLLEKENVNISHVKRSSKKTTRVFVELKGTIPSFVFRRGADTDIRKDDIDEMIFADAKWFHFGSLSLTENPIRKALFHCLKMAKIYNLTVSFSPNLRSDLWHKGLDAQLFRALGYVDILMASRNEFEYMFGPRPDSNAFEAISKKYGIGKIVVTRGKAGCLLYSGANGKIIRHSAFPVDAVDTTGAGDAFAAGFVHSLLKGKGDREALRFASAVAALSTTKKGAMSGLPSLKGVEGFLGESLGKT